MRRSSRPFAAILLTLVLPALARGTTFVAMSEHALARAADAIVVGRIEGLETVGSPDGAIHTLVSVRVEATYKGDVGAEVVLKQPGGVLADRAFIIPGSPVFVRGDRDLLFLSAARDGTARTTAFGLGQFRLGVDAAGDAVAERVLRERVIGGRPVRRLKLRRLLRAIDRAARADARSAAAPLVPVPAEATAPGLERMTVERFTLMDTPDARWHEADEGKTVVYGYDAAGDPALGPDASFAALDAAFAAWTNVDGATIVLARGTPTDPMPLICDGLSQIVFGDPFDEMPSPVACSGILALGGYCTKGAANVDVVNGVRFQHIAEGNITFNKGFGSCSFWNETNLAEVATHEIGHTIGIGHSSERDDEPSPVLKDATMYYRAHFDGRGGSVRSDDVAAVRFIYPGPTAEVSNDVDGDGVPDDVDNCPGNSPTLGIANPSQTDTDGDGIGDLCDACPLVPAVDGVQSCDPITDSTLRVTDGGAGSRLTWRGSIQLAGGADLSAARVLLTGAYGVLVDTASAARTRRRSPGPRRHVVYRNDTAVVELRRLRGSTYEVRVAARNVDMGAGAVPVVSASLEVGTTSFSTSLSCPPRGTRRFTCRG